MTRDMAIDHANKLAHIGRETHVVWSESWPRSEDGRIYWVESIQAALPEDGGYEVRLEYVTA